MLDHNRNLRIGSANPSDTPGVPIYTSTQLPADGYVGEFIYVSDWDSFRIWDGDQWRDLKTGSGTFVSDQDPAVADGVTVSLGDTWLNTETGLIQVWNGTAWVASTVTQNQITSISVDKLTSGTLAATEALSVGSTTGEGIVIGTDDSGQIGIWGRASDGHNRFELPTDPTAKLYFEGDAVIDDLTVTGTLTAATGVTLVQGKTLTLATTQQNPSQAPQVSATWDTATWPAPSGGWSLRKTIAYYANSGDPYLYMLSQVNSNRVDVEAYHVSTKTRTWSYTLPESTTNIRAGGAVVFTRQSDSVPFLLVSYHRTMSNGNKMMALKAFNISGIASSPTYQAIDTSTTLEGYFANTTTDGIGLAWDGTYTSGLPTLYMFGKHVSSNVVRVAKFTSDIFNSGGDAVTALGTFNDTTTVTDISVHAAFVPTATYGGDFGATRYLYCAHSANAVVQAFEYTSSATHHPELEFETAASSGVVGMWWDGTNYYSLDYTGIQRKHEADASLRFNNATSDGSWYAAYTWTNAGETTRTQRSPATYLKMSRRAKLMVTTPDLPPTSGSNPVTGRSIYLCKTTDPGTDVSVANMHLNSGLVTTTATTLSSVSWTSASNPTTNGFVSVGATPTQIKNDTGTLIIDGNGSITTTGITISGMSWQTPTITGWTSGTPAIAYRLSGIGEVMMRGTATRNAGASGDTLFTLSSGYRPPVDLLGFPVMANSWVVIACDILATGVVRLTWTGTAPTNVWLNNVRFSLL